MRLSAPIQLLIIALTAQSSASPLAVPASSDVEVRDSAELASDTAAVVQKRSYQKSCTSCGISNADNNPYMECHCSNSAGKWGPSRVYLNGCIVNINGQMQWAKKYIPRLLSTHPTPGRAFVFPLTAANQCSLSVAASGRHAPSTSGATEPRTSSRVLATRPASALLCTRRWTRVSLFPESSSGLVRPPGSANS